MRAPALIATLLLATPAAAQLPDMTPRSPIQAEQDRRIQGWGFEQSTRTNPQLYPYPPPASAFPPPSPGLSPLTPPPPGLAPLGVSPLSQPIPPVTHNRARRPPPVAQKPPPIPKEKPPVPDQTSPAQKPTTEEEKTTP